MLLLDFLQFVRARYSFYFSFKMFSEKNVLLWERRSFIYESISQNLLNYRNMDSTYSSFQFLYVTTFEAIFQYLNFFLSFSSSIHLIRKTLYVLLMIRISLQQNNSGQLLQVATPSHRLMVTQHYFTRILKSFNSFSLVTSRSHLLRHVTFGVTNF